MIKGPSLRLKGIRSLMIRKTLRELNKAIHFMRTIVKLQLILLTIEGFQFFMSKFSV
jgi:hypothetical protein